MVTNNTTDVNWQYGDDTDSETSQFGIRIDAEVASYFRDVVKLANDGTRRNRTGPELVNAIKAFVALYFLQKPYELDRVKAGDVDYIRNSEQFVEITQEFLEEMRPQIAVAADNLPQADKVDGANAGLQSGSSLFKEDNSTENMTDSDAVDEPVDYSNVRELLVNMLQNMEDEELNKHLSDQQILDELAGGNYPDNAKRVDTDS